MQNKRILIVDDDQFTREILAEILQSENFVVQTAENGAAGYDKFCIDKNIDLVITDLAMPEMGGLELIQKLRLKDANVPVIDLSGNDDISNVLTALKKGANEYLVKDSNIEDTILISVNKVLEERRLEEENVRLMNLLERRASLDGLTDIPNRRKFDEMLASEWYRSQRTTSPISLILMDIDFFKRYNDNYGHTSGDSCLTNVAKTISDTLERPTDFAARYGGEEFVVILPGTPSDGAASVAENIRKSVLDLEILHEKSDVSNYVTLSLGVATMTPEQDILPTTIVEAADKFLYQAKDSGRNQTCYNQIT
ncbi:MAG: diguanylate cyclase domain-containing protein [Candidatus Anammoxibacter sp.]